MIKIKSVRMRTLVSILPVTIILLIILSVSSYFAGKSIISKEIDSKINYKMNELKLSIDNRLNSHGRIAQTLARTVEVSDTSFTNVQYENLVEKFTAINGDTLGAGIWFEPNKYKSDINFYGPYAYKDSGKVVYTEDYMKEDYNYPSKDWYKAAKETKNPVAWTAPYYDETTKLTMVTAAAPFYDKTGNFIGTTTADIDLTSLQKIINDLKLGDTGKAFLLTSDGSYIAGWMPAKL